MSTQTQRGSWRYNFRKAAGLDGAAYEPVQIQGDTERWYRMFMVLTNVVIAMRTMKVKARITHAVALGAGPYFVVSPDDDEGAWVDSMEMLTILGRLDRPIVVIPEASLSRQIEGIDK